MNHLSLLIMVFGDICNMGAGDAEKIGHSESHLGAAASSRKEDLVDLFDLGADVGWIRFFHADRRAATANIAGGFFEILEMQHFHTFVAAGAGEFFEIELLVAGDDANDGAGFGRQWRRGF